MARETQVQRERRQITGMGKLDEHTSKTQLIRLWRWEQFRGQLPAVGVHMCMTPQPWARTGPGAAKDGKPRFDLAFFDQLRDRVVSAGNEGIYVSAMLFEGFSLHLWEKSTDGARWEIDLNLTYTKVR